MSLVWLVPLAVVVAGAIAIVVVTVRAAAEVRLLRESLVRVSDVRAGFERLRTDADATRERFGGIHPR